MVDRGDETLRQGRIQRRGSSLGPSERAKLRRPGVRSVVDGGSGYGRSAAFPREYPSRQRSIAAQGDNNTTTGSQRRQAQHFGTHRAPHGSNFRAGAGTLSPSALRVRGVRARVAASFHNKAGRRIGENAIRVAQFAYAARPSQ